jgi:hypothetical protein
MDNTGALLFEVKGSKLPDKGSGVVAHVDGLSQTMRWLIAVGSRSLHGKKP